MPEAAIEDFVLWPPDLFALTSAVLDATEAYRFVASPLVVAGPAVQISWPPKSFKSMEAYHKQLRTVADDWRTKLETISITNYESVRSIDEALSGALPEGLKKRWETFMGGISSDYSESVHDLSKSERREHLISLIELHIIADEAFRMPLAKWALSLATVLHSAKTARGSARGSLSRIDPTRARVLHKRHTPQVGLSLRSISHHMAYFKSSIDVKRDVEYVTEAAFKRNTDPQRLSCLLLPWPLRIYTSAFTSVSGSRSLKLPQSFGSFAYDPDPSEKSPSSSASLRRYLDECFSLMERDSSSKVDLVVLPELALRTSADTMGVKVAKARSKGTSRGSPDEVVGDLDDIADLENTLGKYGVGLYVCGARHKAVGHHFHHNGVVIGKANGTSYIRQVQHKHHRWILDEVQVAQYGLGSVLKRPPVKWVEHISVHERKLHFVEMLEEITICPLICEDLARQDPVAQLIRTIGPTLVVAILMDGPQFSDRWASKYASVLGEDPGSAVITLTSLGMVHRWSSAWRAKRDIVGLWKGLEGPPRELVLDHDALGIHLELECVRQDETSADGRTVRGKTIGLRLIEVHQVRGPRMASVEYTGK